METDADSVEMNLSSTQPRSMSDGNHVSWRSDDHKIVDVVSKTSVFRMTEVIHSDDLEAHFKNIEMEDCVACSQVIQSICRDNLEERGSVWKCRRIPGHTPVPKHHVDHKGSSCNVLVKWEIGEVTNEPLNWTICEQEQFHFSGTIVIWFFVHEVQNSHSDETLHDEGTGLFGLSTI